MKSLLVGILCLCVLGCNQVTEKPTTTTSNLQVDPPKITSENGETFPYSVTKELELVSMARVWLIRIDGVEYPFEISTDGSITYDRCRLTGQLTKMIPSMIPGPGGTAGFIYVTIHESNGATYCPSIGKMRWGYEVSAGSPTGILGLYTGFNLGGVFYYPSRD